MAVMASAIAFVLHHVLFSNTGDLCSCKVLEYLTVVLLLAPRNGSFIIMCTGMECNASTLKLLEGLDVFFPFHFAFGDI